MASNARARIASFPITAAISGMSSKIMANFRAQGIASCDIDAAGHSNVPRSATEQRVHSGLERSLIVNVYITILYTLITAFDIIRILIKKKN